MEIATNNLRYKSVLLGMRRRLRLFDAADTTEIDCRVSIKDRVLYILASYHDTLLSEKRAQDRVSF